MDFDFIVTCTVYLALILFIHMSLKESELPKIQPSIIKKETEDFLRENKNYLLTYKPETYYAMKNQKLPKKYQKKQRINIAPVNAFVPPQSKLSAEELQKQMEKESELQKEKKAKVNITTVM